MHLCVERRLGPVLYSTYCEYNSSKNGCTRIYVVCRLRILWGPYWSAIAESSTSSFRFLWDHQHPFPQGQAQKHQFASPSAEVSISPHLPFISIAVIVSSKYLQAICGVPPLEKCLFSLSVRFLIRWFGFLYLMLTVFFQVLDFVALFIFLLPWWIITIKSSWGGKGLFPYTSLWIIIKGSEGRSIWFLKSKDAACSRLQIPSLILQDKYSWVFTLQGLLNSRSTLLFRERKWEWQNAKPIKCHLSCLVHICFVI